MRGSGMQATKEYQKDCQRDLWIGRLRYVPLKGSTSFWQSCSH